jgi:hypothetical protein
MDSPSRNTRARSAPTGAGAPIELVTSQNEAYPAGSPPTPPSVTRIGRTTATGGSAFFPAPRGARKPDIDLTRASPTLELSMLDSDDDSVEILPTGVVTQLPPSPDVENDPDWEMKPLTAHTSEASGFKRWFGTLNNPTELELNAFRPGIYGMGQVEIGESGTKHFQFFCVLSRAQRLSGMKKINARAYWAPMKGTIEHCEAYCSKDDTAVSPPQRYTWGTKPLGRGARSDLMDVARLVLAGGSEKVAREMPWAYIKYSRGIKDLAAELPVKFTVEAPDSWHQWQTELLDVLATSADNRSIRWYVDGTGGAGKSTLLRYVCANGKPCSAISLSGKVTDMAFAYKGESAVFFDVSRTMAENVKHLAQFAEQLKNGNIFSTKYESRTKMFKPPHVVFFANIMPPSGMWSADRLKLTELSPVPAFAASSAPLDCDLGLSLAHPTLFVPASPASPPTSTLRPMPRAPHKRSRTDALISDAQSTAVHPCADCSKMINIKFKRCVSCM